MSLIWEFNVSLGSMLIFFFQILSFKITEKLHSRNFKRAIFNLLWYNITDGLR